MHLLQAQPGEISDGGDPVDPDQTPADLIVISAADTELAGLSAALQARGEGKGPSVRLANLSWLTHPYAVDLYLDKTALRSRLVVARVLGGAGYWSYGLEQFSRRLREAGVAFAALPGDDKPDDALFEASSLPRETWQRLWGYLVEGGPDNAANFLADCAHLLGQGDAPAGPAPLLRAGFYWPGAGVADLERLRAAWVPGRPVAALVFYRAL
ncbi:MAG: cobaltochelatase subunit CobN, partial [Pseudomonadota bacterium]